MTEPLSHSSGIRRDLVLSVVIPVWNRADSIEEAILSALDRSSPDWEIIVVDDGSTDDSAQVVSKMIADRSIEDRVRLVQQANKGAGAARNSGARAASGEYVAFLDSDDFWFPWTVAECLKIASSSRAELIFFQSNDIASDHDAPLGTREPLMLREYENFLAAVAVNRAYRFSSCNFMIKRRDLMSMGGFDERMRCSEDTDLFLRSNGSLRVALVMAPAMVAHRLGSRHQLTTNYGCVLEGYRAMRSKFDAGIYSCSGQEVFLFRMMAGAAVRAVRVCLAFGPTLLAYRVLLENLHPIIRAGLWAWLLKLLLTPVLHLIKPGSFPFRERA